MSSPHLHSRRFHLLIFLLLLSFSSAAPDPPPKIGSVNRATTWQDISSTFHLVYSISSNCPKTLKLSKPTPDYRNVGLIPLSSIFEDQFQCSGKSPLSLVTEETLTVPGLLAQAGLSGFQVALDVNKNAYAVATHSNDSQMIVGWHENSRSCGTKVYDSNTIYFFIRERKGYVVEFLRGNVTERIEIPSMQTAVLIIPARGSDICLLSDKSSNPDLDVTLTTDQQGTVVLTPAGLLPSFTPFPSSSTGSDSGVEAGDDNSPVSTLGASIIEPTPNFGIFDNDGDFDDDSSPEPSPFISSVPACFPSSARLTSNFNMKMSEIPIGLITKPGGRILFFTHRDSNLQSSSFKRLSFSFGQPLTLSSGHYIPIINHNSKLIPASHVKMDGTYAVMCAKSGFPKRVTAVEDVCAIGLHNPQTEGGIIGVEDVVVSTYTTAVRPDLAHCGVRLWSRFLGMWNVGGRIVSWLLKYGAMGFAVLLPRATEGSSYVI